jgi:hypothetical protein
MSHDTLLLRKSWAYSKVDTRANDEALLTTVAVVVNGDDVARLQKSIVRACSALGKRKKKYRNVAANRERCVFLVDGHGVGDGGRDMEEKEWVLEEYKARRMGELNRQKGGFL